MCAPTKDLVKIAVLAGAAYATGGISLGATGATAATTATTAATTATTAASSSGMFSTIANVIKIGAPILGAAGNIYSGMIQSNMLKAKANFVDFSIGMDAEASALRKIQRARNMRATIESQKAKYGVSGITLEGTPTDILSETSAKFAEDQFIDDFNTSQKMYGKQISAGQLRTEAQAAVLGGVTTAATTLAMRGFSPSATTKPSIFTQIPMGTGEPF